MTSKAVVEADGYKEGLEDLKNRIREVLGYQTAPAEMSDALVVDHVVSLRELKSLVEARSKLLGEVLKNRLSDRIEALSELPEGVKPEFKVEGLHTPGLKAISVTQRRFDEEGVKEEMGNEWYEEHCKTIQFVQLKALK